MDGYTTQRHKAAWIGCHPTALLVPHSAACCYMYLGPNTNLAKQADASVWSVLHHESGSQTIKGNMSCNPVADIAHAHEIELVDIDNDWGADADA